MKQRTHAPSLGAQLDIFALLDAAEDVSPPPRARPAAEPHPKDAYLIRSASERGYWSNDLGWVYDVASATPFRPAQACGATLKQWRADGKPITSPKGNWMWIARSGGLAGHRGADFDGPFRSEEDALEAALATLGPDKPLLVQRDAEYVSAKDCTDFDLDD